MLNPIRKTIQIGVNLGQISFYPNRSLSFLIAVILLFLISLFVQGTAVAQAPSVDWNRTYGGSEDDEFSSVIQISDGGYIAVGYTRSAGDVGGDAWLLRVNSAGDVVWNKTYGDSSGWDRFYSIIQTSDGGYMVAKD